MSACKHTVSGSFSLPSRGAFHLSLTVLFAIGHMVVFSLRRWSSCRPDVLRIPLTFERFRLRDCYPLRCGFPTVFNYHSPYRYGVLTPHVLLHAVWAPPISLATTLGIVITFFSSGYLDVSVPRVPLLCLLIQHKILQHYLQ